MHLQVIQEPIDVQTPFSSIPVVVRTDIFKTSISEHTVVVFWEEEEDSVKAPLGLKKCYFPLLTPGGCRHIDGGCHVVDTIVPAPQKLCPHPQRSSPAQRLDPSHLRENMWENMKTFACKQAVCMTRKADLHDRDSLFTRLSLMAGLSSPRATLAAAERNSGRPRMGRYSWFRLQSSTISCSTFFTTGSTQGWQSSVR